MIVLTVYSHIHDNEVIKSDNKTGIDREGAFSHSTMANAPLFAIPQGTCSVERLGSLGNLNY